MPTLTAEERQSMLAEPLIAVIAIEQQGRAPVAVPIWYSPDDDGRLWIMTGRGSLKARLLRNAGRCTLTVQTVEPHLRYVAVECELVEERELVDADLEHMARRYLPPEAADGYIAWAKESLPPESVFVFRQVGWLSGDLTL